MLLGGGERGKERKTERKGNRERRKISEKE